MLNRLPKNLYPNFNTSSRIPLKVREIIENVLENPVKIPNYLGRNSDNNKINYNFLSAEFYQTNKLQVSSFENKKHIAEYNNISKLLLDNSLNNYRDNKLIWENTPFNEKKDVFLNAANLLETKYYNQMLAYTIVGQNKTIYEAELDAICELVDFLRFNVSYAEQIIEKQPLQTDGIINISEYNSLNGFVAAITPFNFTAIGGNLASAPLLFGNSVYWKPSDSAILSNHLFYQIMIEAGLPEGVLNFCPMEPENFVNTITKHRELASILFTGSSEVFENIYTKTSYNISKLNNFPRLIGETGGKNFHFVGPNTNKLDNIVQKTIESAFNYSGQKCSSCSIMYVPNSKLDDIINIFQAKIGNYKLSNENYGLINQSSYDKIVNILYNLKLDNDVRLVLEGIKSCDNTFLVEPHIFICNNHEHYLLNQEFFAPILTIYPYDDKDIDSTIDICIDSNNYALTGSVFSDDADFIEMARDKFKTKTGNFYINDKSTGSVVGQQPFGGSGKSGTNDKAGDMNLLYRLCNQRNIKINIEG